jgi:UDPglucose 6-dehydrogenase
MEKTREAYPEFRLFSSAYEAADGADVVVVATEWPEFRKLDWTKVRDSMARPLVIDGRNLLVPADMKALGFEYHSMGRPDDGENGEKVH